MQGWDIATRRSSSFKIVGYLVRVTMMSNPPGALPSVADRFTHIVSAIGNVEETLNGISEKEPASDRVRRLALERLLEIISIASTHIPASLKATENFVDWQAIADIG